MKTIYWILLATILTSVLLFSSCGTSTVTQTTTAPAVTQTTTAPAVTQTTTTTVSTEPIKIGALFPTSGVFAGSMAWVVPALQMGLDDANAAGGAMGGRKFQLVTLDTQGDPSVVAQRADQLKAQGCVGIIGTLLDATDVALGQWADVNKFPVILNSNSQELRIGLSPYQYFISPGSWGYANVFAQDFAQLKVKSIYSINADLGFTHEFDGYLWAKLAKIAPEIVNLGGTYVGLMEMDFSNVISTAISKNPDLVWAGEAGPPFANFIQQVQQFGLLQKSKVAGAWMLGPDSTTPFGKDYPQGLVGVTMLPFYDSSDAKIKSFSDAYFKANQTYPADITLEAYAGTASLAQVVKQANSTAPADILSGLAKVSFDSPVGTLSYASYDHSIHFPLWVGNSGNSPNYPIAIGVNLTKFTGDLYPSEADLTAARQAAKTPAK